MTEVIDRPEVASPAALSIAPGPHIESPRTTRAVMADVLIALAPAAATGLVVFGWRAAVQVAICTTSCVFFEAMFQFLRRRRQTVGDLSAAVTGLILGLSIPWTAPWYAGFIGSGVAIIVVKMFFGGLGSNVFNPAMAGRAFLQACFTGAMTTYKIEGCPRPGLVDGITGATPLALAKGEAAAEAMKSAPSLWHLFIGTVNGSVGEVSALACLLGGLYLIVRRSAAWRVPVGVLAAAAIVAAIDQLARPAAAAGVGYHLLAGGLMFGAFFIATDPTTSPLTKIGRWIFAGGVGALTMLIRLFASIPEGVMYSVLVMNMIVPLIDRYTVPRPVGGRPKPPAPAGAAR